MSGSWLLVVAALAVPVSHRGADLDGDYDREAARLARASVPELIRRICTAGRYESKAQEILVGRGLSALPALFREEIRLHRQGGGCQDKWPSSFMADALTDAHAEEGAKRRAARAAFDVVLRGLRSRRFDDTMAALSVVVAVSGGDWYSADADKPRARGHPVPTALLESAVEPIMALVRTGQGTLRREALETMASVGAPFARFVPELETLLDDPVARPLVLVAIERIGPAAASVQGRLRARLRDEKDPFWVRRYAEALQHLGPDAKQVLPDLWSRLGDDRGLDCAGRAERIVDVTRLILAIDPDLRASAPQGGGAAFVAAADRGVRASVACQTTATDTLEEMLRKLPAPLTRAAFRAQMTDENLPLRYRMMAAASLSTQGGTLPAPEQELRRILVARRAAQDADSNSGAGLPATVALCRAEGGVSGPPQASRPAPSPRDEESVEYAAQDCLERHLCGPGKDRYRRVLSICCRYAYGDNQPGWCRDGAR